MTALVTGGNRGIGLEVVTRLARAGHRVWLGSRSVPAGEEAAASLVLEGLDVGVVALDVTDARSVAAAAAAVGSLDVLVNNAGIALDGFDEVVARRTMDVNLHGPWRVTDELRGQLAAGARIVMVSSGSGERSSLPLPARRRIEEADDVPAILAVAEDFVAAVADGSWRAAGWPCSAYAMSKACLGRLTELLAQQLPDVRVNAVCPGWVRTDMGGGHAPRSVAEGAAGVVWAAELPPAGPTGGFFRDGRRIDW